MLWKWLQIYMETNFQWNENGTEEVFLKNCSEQAVLKHLAIFTGKQLCWSLLLKKRVGNNLTVTLCQNCKWLTWATPNTKSKQKKQCLAYLKSTSKKEKNISLRSDSSDSKHYHLCPKFITDIDQKKKDIPCCFFC